MIEGTVFRTRTRFDWMGIHSGYDRGCDFLGEHAAGWRFIDFFRSSEPLGSIRTRILKRCWNGCSPSPTYDLHSYLLERKVMRAIMRTEPSLVHLMYLERDLGFLLRRLGKHRPKVIGTSHQPASWWKLLHRHPEAIEGLDGLIVLTEQEAAFWEDYLPGRIHVVRHGVDVDFFTPPKDDGVHAEGPRFLTVGNWLRDIETLSTVVERLVVEVPGVKFDCVFPNTGDPTRALLSLARRKEVDILEGLSDEELRDSYARATALLLPMVDATANNAILEAQACGTPIVSTDLPGLGEYVELSFADLRRVGDIEGLVEAAKRIAEEPLERERRGCAARRHAVERLSWSKQAPRWLEVYDHVLKRKG